MRLARLSWLPILALALTGCVGDSGNVGDGGGPDSTTCGAGTKACNGACVQIGDPNYGCNTSTCAACPIDTARHQAPACDSTNTCTFATTCDTGWGDCDGNPANGCETPTSSDINNCGACKHVCGVQNATAAPTCTAGKCAFNCVAGYAACGPDAQGCNVNVAGTDAKNCGTCGHDCLGGTCAVGACQPVGVASNELYPTSVAADPGTTGYVYWTNWKNPGSVNRRVKDLSAGVEVVAPQSGNPSPILPFGVTTAGQYVYWTEFSSSSNTNVHFANKDGTSMQALSPSVFGPWGISADTTNVFWVDRWDGNLVNKAPIGATTWTNIVSGGTNSNTLSVVAEPDGGVGNVFVAGTNSGLVRYDKTGANSLSLDPSAAAIAIDDTNVYYSQNNLILRKGKDGTCTNPSSPCPLVYTNTVGYGVGGIVVDANYVYWTTREAIDSNYDATDGQVWRANKDFSNVVHFAADQYWISGLAQDDTAIYWGIQCTGCGSVLKLAK